MQTQYFVLGYQVDFCFHDCKLATEIDENRHFNRNIDYKIKRQKEIEKELGRKFLKIDPDEDFDIFRAINEIVRHIKQSTKKT